MNNKGQVLVLFIMLLPITFLLIYFIYNKIYLYGEKNNQTNLSVSLCNYYKNDKDIDDLKVIALKNDKNLKIEIKEEKGKIKITLKKEVKSLMNKKNKIQTNVICE